MRKSTTQPVPPESLEVTHEEVQRICELDLAAARIEWRTTFKKEPPPTLSREFLLRHLAAHIQEQAFGGHGTEALRLLKAYGRQDGSKVTLFKRLKPGTAVVREYQGIRHIVTISDGGFIWEGKTYNSLSAIAQQITGAKWNGPRFFGLRDKDKYGAVKRPAR